MSFYENTLVAKQDLPASELKKIREKYSDLINNNSGKVVKIEYIDDPNIGESAKLVSIFLNVFNVHVNRVPIDGLVVSVERKKGKFLAAFNHIASDENEQIITLINNESGVRIKTPNIDNVNPFCLSDKFMSYTN